MNLNKDMIDKADKALDMMFKQKIDIQTETSWWEKLVNKFYDLFFT